MFFFFFFSSRRRHTRLQGDWSSDVCSSDLAAGLTLEHIRQVLDIRDSGQPPCVHVTGLIARRLGEVEARLAELTRARDQLVVLAARAAEQDPADCRGYCSIIAG